MKALLNNRNPATAATRWAMLLALPVLLLANVDNSLAASAEVTNKKDSDGWRMSWWLGGWEGTGGAEKLYFWMEFGPWNSVFKAAPGGALWFHDSASKGSVVIASAHVGEDANTEPHDIRYIGVGSMVDIGLWKETEPGSGLFDPAEKMTWQIKATVFDVNTGEEWRLNWHLVLRGDEWKETYSFEPVK